MEKLRPEKDPDEKTGGGEGAFQLTTYYMQVSWGLPVSGSWACFWNHKPGVTPVVSEHFDWGLPQSLGSNAFYSGLCGPGQGASPL